MANASHSTRRGLAVWVVYGASTWAFLFAALSFFWALGGRTGLHPFENVSGDPSLLIASNVAAGIGKVLIGLLPLALLQGRRVILQWRTLLIAAWVVGIGMCVYGGLGLVSDVLHVTGVIADPTNREWFLVFLVLWDPWWVLGGILYMATARLVQSSHDNSSG